MAMRRCFDRRTTLKLFGSLIAASDTTAALAADKTAQEIAVYKGADRQVMLEAGARKEGAVLVYTVGSQIDPVLAAFRVKYPFLTVRTLKDDIPRMVQRVVQEYSAGIHEVDAFELNDYGLELLLGQKLLLPFWSPESINFDSAALEPGNCWVLMRQDFAGLGFNTKAVAPDAAPHVYADLLEPKWKGRMALAARPSSLTLWVGALEKSEGEAFVRKLGAQDARLYNIGGAAVDGLVASGEAPLVLDSRRSHIYAHQRAGAPVQWRALGPTYAALSGVALPTEPAHPYSAMLLIDFLLSEHAQRIYADALGYVSMRKDISSPDAPAQKLYLGLNPDFAANYRKWSALAHSAFERGSL
jgi:iron(III) transport system substrate-binding protein